MAENDNKPEHGNVHLGNLKNIAQAALDPLGAFTIPLKLGLTKLVPESVKAETLGLLDPDQEESAEGLVWGGAKSLGRNFGVPMGPVAMGAANLGGAAYDYATGQSDDENSSGRRFARNLRSELIRHEEENPGNVAAGGAIADIGLMAGGAGIVGKGLAAQSAMAQAMGRGAGLGGRVLANAAAGAGIGATVGTIDSAVESVSKQSLRDGDVDPEKVAADAVSGGRLAGLLGGVFGGGGTLLSEAGGAVSTKVGRFLEKRGTNQYLRESGVSERGIREINRDAGDKASDYVRKVMDEAGDDGANAVAKRHAQELDDKLKGLVSIEAQERRAAAKAVHDEAKMQAQARIDQARNDVFRKASVANEVKDIEVGKLQRRLDELLNEEAEFAKRGGLPSAAREEATFAGQKAIKPTPETPGYKPAVWGPEPTGTRKVVPFGEEVTREIPESAPKAVVSIHPEARGTAITEVSGAGGAGWTKVSPKNAMEGPGRPANGVLMDETTNVSPAAQAAQRRAEIERVQKAIADFDKAHADVFTNQIAESAKGLDAARKELAKLTKLEARDMSRLERKLSGLDYKSLTGERKELADGILSSKAIFDKVAKASETPSVGGQIASFLKRKVAGKAIGAVAGGMVGGPVGALAGLGAETALERFAPHYASKGILKLGDIASSVGATMRTDAAARGAVESALGAQVPAALRGAITPGMISSSKDKQGAMREATHRIASVGPEEIARLNQIMAQPGVDVDSGQRIPQILLNIRNNTPKPAVEAGPFGGDPFYSDTDIHEFEDYSSVALDPLQYFKAVRLGHVTPTMTRSMLENWPELHNTMKTHLLQNMGPDKSPDAQAIRRLETMVGEAILPENRKDYVDFNQRAYDQQSRTRQPGSQGGGSRAASKSVKSYALPTESAE